MSPRRRQRSAASALLGVVLIVPRATAQDAAAEHLEAAAAQVAAGEWQAAAATLRQVSWQDAPAGSCVRLAALLQAVGDGYWEQQEFAAALAAYRTGREVLIHVHGAGDCAEVALATTNAASCLFQLGRPGEALAEFERALAMKRRLAPEPDLELVVYLVNIAACSRRLGRNDEALRRYREIGELLAELPDVPADLWSMAKENQAVCLQAMGNEAAALPLLEEVRAVRARQWPEGHPALAKTLSAIGVCLLATGRPRLALESCEQALAMQRRLQPDATGTVIEMLNNVAACLESSGRSGDAARRFEEAIALLDRRGGGDVVHATTLGNFAACLESLGRHRDAVATNRRAVAVLRALGEGGRPLLATHLNNLGHSLRLAGDCAAAIEHHEEALRLLRSRLSGDDADVAATTSNLACCCREAGDPDAALRYHAESVGMLRRLYPAGHPDLAAALHSQARTLAIAVGQQAALAPLEEARRMMADLVPGDHPLSADILACLGDALTATARADAAAAAYRSALDMVEGLRAGLRGLERTDRLAALGERQFATLPARTARALIAAGDAGSALFALERGRARSMLDVLEASGTDPFAAALEAARAAGDEAEVERLAGVRDEVAAAECAVGAVLAARIGTGAAARRDTDRALDAALHRRRQACRQQARALAQWLPFAIPASLAGIRGLVGERELMLVYALDAAACHVVVVPPAPEPVTALPLPSDAATLAAAADGWLRRLSRGEQAAATRGGPLGRRRGRETPGDPAELFAALVPKDLWPRIRASERVWIVPQGPLHRLPFESLVVATASGGPVYWLDRGPPIAYVASASVLQTLRGRPIAAPAAGQLLALGDPAVAAGLPSLPGARDEVAAITEAFAGPATVLLGADATEAKLFAAAPGHRFVHLATHGIAGDAGGHGDSSLVMAAPTDPAADDGLLRNDELLGRWRGRLAACEMVVLSGCRTNIGPQPHDEAPQALPIGFFHAGARSVIASLWSVHDRSTAELMAELYRRLAAGEPRLEAFTTARRALRARHPDPFYWAPFLFYGAAD